MPMAVDLVRFNPTIDGTAIRRELGMQDRFVIGYVGTLSGWHGLNLLFDVARRLRQAGAPKFTMLIVGGDGDKLEANRALVTEAGLQDCIWFVGSVPHEQVPGYIRAMDAAVVPDTTYWSSPSKLFEYMASGVAIVAPRYPAIEEAAQDGAEALVFEPGNIDAMAGAVLRLMRNPDLTRALGAAARARAERERSWHLNGRRILKLFEDLGARLD
jgi:glycosyltransferase involved in cell wall biosynthesis